MGLLIDGHNLIGRMPGIDLADPDDEVRLVAELKRWAAASRKRKVTVIFDGGLPGGRDRSLSNSDVTVIFAAAGIAADSLLISRIQKARDVGATTVVTSDQAIVAAAQRRKMRVLRSEEFALVLANDKATRQRPELAEGEADPQLSPHELSEWLEIFGPEPETPPAVPTAERPKKRPATKPTAEQQRAQEQAKELDDWLRLFGYKE